MNCRQTKDQLPLFVGGDLSPAETARVEEHLAACEVCAAELTGYEEARRSLFVLKGTEGGPAPDLWPAIRAQLGRPKARRWVSNRLFAATAATLLAVVAGARLLTNHQSEETVSPGSGVPAEIVAVSPSDAVPSAPALSYPLEEVLVSQDAAVYETAPVMTTLDPERSEWDEF